MSTAENLAPVQEVWRKLPKSTGRMALSWIDLWKKEGKIRVARKSIGAKLTRLMKKAGVIFLKTPRGIIRLEFSRKKVVLKDDILKYFGKKQGEKFWAKVPYRFSEYLSLIDTA